MNRLIISSALRKDKRDQADGVSGTQRSPSYPIEKMEIDKITQKHGGGGGGRGVDLNQRMTSSGGLIVSSCPRVHQHQQSSGHGGREGAGQGEGGEGGEDPTQKEEVDFSQDVGHLQGCALLQERTCSSWTHLRQLHR